jgi:hypothetical protein
VTVGRPTLFNTVTEWGIPWLPASEKREEQRRGEASPVRNCFKMTRPGDSESKKRFHHHSLPVQLRPKLTFSKVLINRMNPLLLIQYSVNTPRVDVE